MDYQADNPFQSPTAAAGDDIQLTGAAAEALRGTRPWVKFLAVLGAIGMGFMALGLVGVLISAGAAGNGAPMVGLMAVVYAVMIACYAFPVVYMFKYCSRITTFLTGGAPDQLAHALDAQRAVWKSVGVITLVGILLYVVAIVVVISTGVMMAPQPLVPAGGPAPVAPPF